MSESRAEQIADEPGAGRGVDQNAPQRTGWPATLLSPWRAIVQPRAGARQLLAAPPLAYWTTYAAGVLICTAGVLFFALYDDSLKLNQLRTKRADNVWWLGALTLEQRRLDDVWRIWHKESAMTPAEWILLIVPPSLVAATAFLAWLNLVRAHRHGPVIRSYADAWRVVSSSVGLLFLIIVAFGATWTLWHHADLREAAATGHESGYFFPPWIWFLYRAWYAAPCLLLLWVGRAFGAVRKPDPIIPPRCEMCGYDLTLAAPGGRCSECGCSVSESLDQDRRPGSPWERRPRLMSWLTTLIQVLFRPKCFYRALRTRSPDLPAFRFSAYVYASLWSFTVSLIIFRKTINWMEADESWLRSLVDVLTDLDDLLMGVGAACALLVWALLGQRTLAALISTWWILRGNLADFRGAAKVVAYESAYVALIVACTFLLALSVELFGDWIGELIDEDFLLRTLGMNGEEFAYTFTIGSLVLFWPLRYRWARLAIRWSNA